MNSQAIKFVFAVLSAAVFFAAVSQQDFVIKQGMHLNGSLYLYVPYFLWNEAVYKESSALEEPLAVRSINGRLDITITTEMSRVSTDLFTFNTRTFCYNSKCTFPGPTLYCSAGDSIRIKLINKLQNISSNHSDTMHANSTNIYINGLHLNPAINSPFRYLVGDGDVLTYEYTIPEDTMSGVHWYHSRPHGVAALQTMGGLFGAFVVQPKSNYSYNELPAVLTTMPRQLLVLSHLMLDKSDRAFTGDITNRNYSFLDSDYSSDSLSYAYLSRKFRSNIDINATYRLVNTSAANGVVIKDAWFTNGQYQPTRTITPHTWVLFDIVVASGDRIVEIEIRTAVGAANGVSACNMRVLARDGVYLPTTRTATRLLLLQGSTATIAVMCPTEGVYFLQTASAMVEGEEHFGVGNYQTKSVQNLLTLHCSGLPVLTTAPPADLSSIPRPAYLKSLLSVSGSTDASGSDNANGSVVDSWSISTVQSGCCEDLSHIVDGAACNIRSATNGQRYWLGTGADCRLPCYEEVLCSALHGNIATSTSDVRGAGSVWQYPTVQNGDCHYGSFNHYYNVSYYSSGGCIRSGESRATVGNRALSQLISSTEPQHNSTVVHTTRLGAIQEVSLYVHKSFAYPITLQGQLLQFVRHDDVSAGISNILASGDYKPVFNTDSSVYALSGDWIQSVPPLTGRTVFRLRSREYTGHVLIMSNFLKFEDRGLLSEFIVQEPSPSAGDDTEDGETGGSSGGGDSGDGDSSVGNSTTPTGAPSESVHGSVGVHPPSSLFDSPDSAPAEFKCDVAGRSYLYNETIDQAGRVRVITTNSCPNHYSVCQNAECGGEIVTRSLIHRQTFTIPLYPGIAVSTPRDVTCTREMVGVALNGVGFYSMSDGHAKECRGTNVNITAAAAYGRTLCNRNSKPKGLLYCGDVVATHGREFDKCGGLQDGSGYYKYHTTPACLANQLANNSAFGHSPQLGWSLDGFPVYGGMGPKNIRMVPCDVEGAHPQLCLDACNGYFGALPGYDEYMYRYYLPGEVASGQCSSVVENVGKCTRQMNKCCASTVPRSIYRPYSIGCFKGCVHGDASCVLSATRGYSKRFVPSVSSHVVSVYAGSGDEAPTNGGIDGGDGSDSAGNNNTAAVISVASTALSHLSHITASRNPFTRTVSILNFTETTTVTQFSDNSTTTRQSIASVDTEELLSSSHDAFITGMTRDHDTEILYYTTQRAIYSFNERTKVTTNLIAGLLEVIIHGYNLGASLQDIEFVKVNGSLCTSVLHLSPNTIKCLSVKSTAVDAEQLSAADVTVATIGGTTSGLYPNPQTVVRSGSGRPVIEDIELNSLPFVPYALQLVLHTSLSAGATTERTLYWSNIAQGAYNIQRSRADGSQIETVVSNVQNAVSLHVLPVLLDSSLAYIAMPDNATYRAQYAVGEVIECVYYRSSLSGEARSFSRGFVENIDYEPDIIALDKSCVNVGHQLLFLDANQGVLAKTAVLPINTQYVFTPHAVDTLRDRTFYSAFTPQESTKAVSDFFSSVVLLRGVDNPRGMAVERDSRILLITVKQGLVFKLQLDYLLTATADSFLSASYGAASHPTGAAAEALLLAAFANSTDSGSTASPTPSTSTVVSSSGDVSPLASAAGLSSGGIELTNSVTGVASAAMAYLPATLTDTQYTLNIDSLLRQGRAARRALPSWLSVLVTAPSKTRFCGVAAAGLVNVGVDSSNGTVASWNQQRILVLDANQQELLVVTDAGYPVSALDIGSKFGVFWPSQVLLARPTGGGVRDSHLASSTSSAAIYTVYISEQLGRVWKFTIQRDSHGNMRLSETLEPILLVDRSVFPVSNRMREILQSARGGGVAAFQKAFNEVF